jgi:protoporphyrinogen oxidase
LAINSVSINAITGSLLRRKEKEIEIAKEVFQRRARAKERLPHIRGQKNTTSRSNRQENSLAKDIDINTSRDKLDKLGTQYTFNYNKCETSKVNEILIRLPKKVTILLLKTQKETRILINALKTPDPATILQN